MFKSPRIFARRTFYLVSLLLANGFVWVVAFLYAQSDPTYSTGLTMSLPPASPRSNVNVGDGQAQIESGNAFGLVTLDPRESYKLLLTSGPVLEKVAEELELTPGEIESRVDIALPPSTNLVQFSMNGPTAEEAQEGAKVLFRTFLARVNQLRDEEIALRNQIAQEFIDQRIDELNEAESALANFRAETGLISTDQLARVTDSLELLRSQHADASARLAAARTRQNQLTTTLGITPAQANLAFLLQSDRTFRASISAVGQMETELADLTATRGRNHPSVLTLKAELDSVQNNIEQSVGQPLDTNTLQQLAIPDEGGQRETLLSQLIQSDAEAHGLESQVIELDAQISNLIQRQANLSRQAETLVELDQRAQILRVVLTSTTGALTIRETDVTSNYPLVQLVIPPALPESPISPKKSYAIIGAFLGSMFMSIAITLLYTQRHGIKNLVGQAVNAELPLPDETPSIEGRSLPATADSTSESTSLPTSSQ